MSENNKGRLETHVSLVLQALVIAGVLWLGSSIIDLKDRVAELKGTIAVNSQKVEDALRRIGQIEERAERTKDEQRRRTDYFDQLKEKGLVRDR